MNLFKRRKNILILGGDGMLGTDLFNFLYRSSMLTNSCIGNVRKVSRSDVDVEKDFSLDRFLSESRMRYDYVINCTAMTDTVGAETNKKDTSYSINSLACKKIADECSFHNAHLIHISTDYVFSYNGFKTVGFFDGFTETDNPCPVNTYGLHKLLGEEFIKNTMKPNKYTILRTSWLYGCANKKSFVHKFINNLKNNIRNGNNTVDCTSNEYSVPTSTSQLSRMIYNVIDNHITGVCHAVVPVKKPVSRYDWCAEILNNLKEHVFSTKKFSKIESLHPVEVTDANIDRPECSLMICRRKEIFKLYENLELDWKVELKTFIDNNILTFIEDL